ncbi:adenosylcobinamide-phosphate synthase CbiB [Hydrogenophilus islandicus]
MSALVALVVGLLWDRIIGEPRRFHPIVAFGRWAERCEGWARRRWLLPATEATPLGEEAHNRWRGRLAGIVAWGAAVAPPLLLYGWASAAFPRLQWLIDGVVLGVALGWRSLDEHVRAVAEPLARGDLPTARHALAQIVSRDTAPLDATGIATAATESALENGHDAVIAPLVWFALAGGWGVVVHRLVNTLDAMWGYRTPRYRDFGWFAARADDLLGWPSARVTALAYALAGDFRSAWRCWQRQAPHWPSPNAGPVMAAGAGALGVRLGGPAPYHGAWRNRPPLGWGNKATPETPYAALALLKRATLGVIVVVALWVSR